jgi:ATP-dependent DNA helicase RecG
VASSWWGLSDGEVEDVVWEGEQHNAFLQASRDFCDPPVRVRSQVLVDVGAGRQVLVFDVPPSDVFHEVVGGGCFLRVGDESRRLSAEEANELRFDKSSQHHETTVVHRMRRSDLETRLLRNYVDRLGHPSQERLYDVTYRSRCRSSWVSSPPASRWG